MRLVTNGILVNQFNQILLIQRNDTRTFAEPGGGLEKGELPPDNIAREVREETGIIALPVRLVSLNFWALPPQGYLAFTFRCLQRGGELQTSAESPRVGFYGTTPLPRPMLPVNRQRIECALRHAGGPVEWWRVPYPFFMRLGRFFLFNVLYKWYDWRRERQGLPAYQAPPDWEVTVRVVLQNEQRDVLWRQSETGWHLPGGIVPAKTPPWDTAVALTQQQTGISATLTDVGGIYVAENSSRMMMVFTAVTTAVTHAQPTTTAHWQWLSPAQTPPDVLPHWPEIVRQTTTPDGETAFAYLPDY